MPLGPWELAIILVIVIIIFGAGKLPEIGGALGKGIREFRETARDEEEPEEAHASDSAASNEAEYAGTESSRQNEPTRKNEPAKEEL